MGRPFPQAKRQRLSKDQFLGSALVSGWLEDVGAGLCSVSDIQTAAARATAQGVDDAAVSAIASLGSSGLHRQNLERDLHSLLQRANLPLNHCPITWVNIPMKADDMTPGMLGAKSNYSGSLVFAGPRGF
jgi:hypothetical protein